MGINTNNLQSLANEILKKAGLISSAEILDIFSRYGLEYAPSNDNLEYKLCAIIQALEKEIETAQEETANCRRRCRTLEEELNKE